MESVWDSVKPAEASSAAMLTIIPAIAQEITIHRRITTDQFPRGKTVKSAGEQSNVSRAWIFRHYGLFLFWGLWYDLKVMAGMIIAVSSELEECENVNVPETEEYLTA